LALLSGGIILPHKYGVRRHNRFIMAVTFLFDTIVFCELISIGYTVQQYTYPWFSKGLQLDCLRNTPLLHTLEECQPFYDSSRTAGFRLFWEAYYTGKGDKFKFQVLQRIEGGCCGFFPPFNCIVNEGRFPKNRLTDGIDGQFLKHKVDCGNYPDYYPEQVGTCTNYYDVSVNPPLVGGCKYDLGVGFCLNTQDIDKSAIGCAAATEDYVIALISGHAVMIMMSSTFNAIFMLFACCMWWKRKETDIFPEFVTEKNTSVQYAQVKDQFVVIPMKNLLRAEGYLPQLTDDENGGGSVENSLEDDLPEAELLANNPTSPV